MWLNLAEVVATLLAAAVLIPCAVLMLEVTMALRFRAPRVSVGERAGSVAVLIPAHNEESGIAATVSAVREQLREGDRLLVVADNCADDTASAAEAAGAEVTVRNDASRVGKGYALDHGLCLLNFRPSDVLIIIDADCTIEPGAIDALAIQCLHTVRPAQALYVMGAPEGANLGTRIAAFAWRVKNQVRAMGSAVLGWPCQVMGAGFAIPWPLISQVELASGNIVEDMRLGVDLVLAGAPTQFCMAARVDSTFPSTERGRVTQRRRWEHGHLATILAECPRLFAAGFAGKGIAPIAMAMDLAVPPVALLAAMTSASLLLSVVTIGLTTAAVPILLSAMAIVCLATAVLVAWWCWARDVLRPRDLLGIPGYVLAKVPLYVRFLRKRETAWVRTDRD